MMTRQPDRTRKGLTVQHLLDRWLHVKKSKLKLLDSCSSCGAIIDARCYARWKSAYYHRVVDCLLPAFNMLQSHLAEGRSLVVPRSKTCVLGDMHVIYPYVSQLFLANESQGFVDATAMSCQAHK